MQRSRDKKYWLLFLCFLPLCFSVSFFKKSPPPQKNILLLEPLTIPEKILLGYRFSPNDLGSEEWEALPQVGPSLARKIVAYRDLHGPFPTLQALGQVPGVGEKTLKTLKPFLKDGGVNFLTK